MNENEVMKEVRWDVVFHAELNVESNDRCAIVNSYRCCARGVFFCVLGCFSKNVPAEF